jgi:hypothetical protein
MLLLKLCEVKNMNEKYFTLFKELAKAAEVIAEQVMEYDH